MFFFEGDWGWEEANVHFNDSGTKCGVMVRRNNKMVDGEMRVAGAPRHHWVV